MNDFERLLDYSEMYNHQGLLLSSWANMQFFCLLYEINPIPSGHMVHTMEALRQNAACLSQKVAYPLQKPMRIHLKNYKSAQTQT